MLTEADLQRGWVEVPKAMRIRVRSNSPEGYLLTFALQEGPFSEVEVTGLAREGRIQGPYGWLPQPRLAASEATLDLGCRFRLAPGATAGAYTWPITLSALPL